MSRKYVELSNHNNKTKRIYVNSNKLLFLGFVSYAIRGQWKSFIIDLSQVLLLVATVFYGKLIITKEFIPIVIFILFIVLSLSRILNTSNSMVSLIERYQDKGWFISQDTTNLVIGYGTPRETEDFNKMLRERQDKIKHNINNPDLFKEEFGNFEYDSEFNKIEEELPDFTKYEGYFGDDSSEKGSYLDSYDKGNFNEFE